MGGGDGAELINVTALSGFGLPAKDYKTVEFAGENGSTLIGERDMARVITISATVRGERRERTKINKVFHESGELYCIFDDVRRKISCRVTAQPEFVRCGKSNLYTFTVQLQADYPYFTEFNQRTIALYSQRNLVTDTFTLPCVFTERISRKIIYNNGDKYVYPKLIITNVGSTSDETGKITIENHTTGAKITVEYTPSNGEIITVDTSMRRLYSNISGSITNNISDDTDLSSFYFDIGENDIEFKNTAQGQVLNAVAVFSPEFYSAEV